MSGDDDVPLAELAYNPRISLAAGWVAASPLFLFYELGRAAGGDRRNAAELLLGRAIEPLGEWARPITWLLLAAATAYALKLAWAEAAWEERSLPRSSLLSVGEGLVAAILLGPLLVFLQRLIGFELEALSGDSGPAPGLALSAVGRLVGGAAWEELLFRVGVFSGLWFLVSRIARFFSLTHALIVPLAELVAFLGSALAFASFHLEVVSRPLGFGGEPYDEGLFLWRTLAGLALAALFRWRGFGVAAWCHGFFNFALALGVGPGVV